MNSKAKAPGDATLSPSNKSAEQLAAESVIGSGLPFQMAVERWIEEARASGQGPSAHFVARELPWALPELDRSGYADLVLEVNSQVFCVVECKREKGGPIPFLRSSSEKPPGAFSVLRTGADPRRLIYSAAFYEPTDANAATFCVFKDTERRIFENIASEVNLATEALALRNFYDPAGRRAYLPVILTNLPLVFCEVELEGVDRRTGELDWTKLASREVPFVRFQKAISTIGQYADPSRSPVAVSAGNSRGRMAPRNQNFREEASLDERTVWVVNSERLTEFLAMVQGLGFEL